MAYKKSDYDFISFLNHTAVIKVSNKEEFDLFKKVLETLHISDILGKEREFEDWQRLAVINRHNPNLFLFEYDNYKGLTWSDNEKEAKDWYGRDALKINSVAKELHLEVPSEISSVEVAYKTLLKEGYDQKYLAGVILSLPSNLNGDELLDLAREKLDKIKQDEEEQER